MTWVVRLAKIGADGEEHWVDVAQIAGPSDLGDIANLGLTMSEGKLVLAGLQQEFVAGEAREHAAVCRPGCRIRGGVCCVKDYREHQVATLFGCAMVRLARFCCARCGVIEAGNEWPLHCRSTPELDRFQAHLSALMPHREAGGARGDSGHRTGRRPKSRSSGRAMLVSLSVSIWSARKHDPRISDKVAAEHGADRSMGRYAKHLIPRDLLAAATPQTQHGVGRAYR